MGTIGLSHPSASTGLACEEWWEYMISTNAVSRGDVVVVNEAVVEGTTKLWTTVIQAAAATDDTLENGIFGVAMEDIAALGTGRILWRGRIDALAGTGGWPTTIGLNLAAETAADGLIVAVINQKVIAKSLEITTATARGTVMFDGWNGFGSKLT
jgi:hypothetical protein